jgi:membrane protease YdiL (CAAX protease family)
MLALAVLDTVVVVAFGFMVAGRIHQPKVVPEPPRVVIGVTADASFGGPGVRVQGVVESSPAAVAGLRAGDVVASVAGREVNSADELRKVIGEQEAGVPIELMAKRGDALSVVTVTPIRSTQMPRPKSKLFEPAVGEHACFAGATAPTLLPWLYRLLILGAVALVGVLAGRHRAGPGVWWTGASIVSAEAGAYAALGGTCLILGGPTAAGAVFSLWGSSLGLATTSLAARAFFVKQPSQEVPTPTPWTSTVGLGFWYAATGSIRLAVLLAALIDLMHAQSATANPLSSFTQGLGGVEGPGLLLVALPVIFFGPVGEEVAFRGLLQPALGRWLPTAGAVGLSSVLFGFMHWYYGPLVPVAVFFGVILGWARVVSGGVRAPIVLHMLINAVIFIPMVLRAMRAN